MSTTPSQSAPYWLSLLSACAMSLTWLLVAFLFFLYTDSMIVTFVPLFGALIFIRISIDILLCGIAHGFSSRPN